MLVVRAMKISQLTRQPPGGMPSTYDSMHKTLGHFSRDKRLKMRQGL
jgi:hypothetical protein